MCGRKRWNIHASFAKVAVLLTTMRWMSTNIPTVHPVGTICRKGQTVKAMALEAIVEVVKYMELEIAIYYIEFVRYLTGQVSLKRVLRWLCATRRRNHKMVWDGLLRALSRDCDLFQSNLLWATKSFQNSGFSNLFNSENHAVVIGENVIMSDVSPIMPIAVSQRITSYE